MTQRVRPSPLPCGWRGFASCVAMPRRWRTLRCGCESYHLERNHQGLDNRPITGTPVADAAGRVRRGSRLGGLLNYERAA